MFDIGTKLAFRREVSTSTLPVVAVDIVNLQTREVVTLYEEQDELDLWAFDVDARGERMMLLTSDYVLRAGAVP